MGSSARVVRFAGGPGEAYRVLTELGHIDNGSSPAIQVTDSAVTRNLPVKRTEESSVSKSKNRDIQHVAAPLCPREPTDA